jgi:cytoskeletal protein RodZ
LDFDLAKFRAEKGISLHEISTKLNIPEKFLLAIEELNFDELPAPIFAKSQIKKYCSFFDLEPSIILEKYEEYSKEKNISDEDESLESSESFFF